MIKLRPGFKRFIVYVIGVIVGIVALVLMFLNFGTVVTSCEVAVLMMIQTFIVIGVLPVAVVALVVGILHIIARWVVEGMPIPRFPAKVCWWIMTVSLAIGVAFSPYAIILHYRIERRIQPIAEQFMQYSGCGNWECYADYDALKARDKIAHDSGAMRIGWWSVTQDSQLICWPDHLYNGTCYDTEAIYLLNLVDFL